MNGQLDVEQFPKWDQPIQTDYQVCVNINYATSNTNDVHNEQKVNTCVSRYATYYKSDMHNIYFIIVMYQIHY